MLAIAAGIHFGAPSSSSAQAPFTLTWEVPVDSDPPLSTPNARLHAWKLFVALNWPALAGQPAQPDQTKTFGTPGPVVWSGFMDADALFAPEDGKTPPWGGNAVLPKGSAIQTKGVAKTSLESAGAVKVLQNLSKVSAKFEKAHKKQAPTASALESFDINQPTPQNAWLTDQTGQPAYYEIKVNQDEYNYVVKNKLNTLAGQKAAIAAAPGISLPSGKTEYGSQGTLELKAAWRVFPAGTPTPANYYTVSALIKDPNATTPDTFTNVTVGLVALHIIHKTPSAPQFIWCTFEHVDNCPDINQNPPPATAPSGNPWTFFSASSTASPNQAPPATQSKSTPIQVVRAMPLAPAVMELNQQMWTAIKAVNPSSVWLNYQLVDAQWPQNAQTIPPNQTTPISNLLQGNVTPAKLYNTIIETYLQPGASNPQNSCIACHAFGAAAPKLNDKPIFSDFSFLFGLTSE